MYPSMSVTEICGQIQEAFLARPEFSLEYFEIVNSDTLQPVKHRDEPARAFIAVHLEGIRLIDNCPLN
jgi:pantothenate synthetase